MHLTVDIRVPLPSGSDQTPVCPPKSHWHCQALFCGSSNLCICPPEYEARYTVRLHPGIVLWMEDHPSKSIVCASPESRVCHPSSAILQSLMGKKGDSSLHTGISALRWRSQTPEHQRDGRQGGFEARV